MYRRTAHGRRDNRSYRHTPILSLSACPSEKKDKLAANRTLRARVRAWMAADGDTPDTQPTPPPTLRQVSNVWSMGKDGRSWQETGPDWVEAWENPSSKKHWRLWHR